MIFLGKRSLMMKKKIKYLLFKDNKYKNRYYWTIKNRVYLQKIMRGKNET